MGQVSATLLTREAPPSRVGARAPDHARLAHTWVVWAQKAPLPTEKRGQAVEVGDFATVEEFWTTWRWVPPPSEAFNQLARPAAREHQCRLEDIPGVVGLAAQAVDLGFGRRSSF